MKKLNSLVAAACIAVGLLAATPAIASAATTQASSCRLSYTASHNADSVSATFSQTCGISWRAWGDWQNAGYHYGTYRKCPGCSSPYSVACAVPSTCGSGGGSFWSGGIQRKDTGHMRCLWGCGAVHTAALVKPADDYDCDGLTWQYAVHLQPGGLGVQWNPDADSSATDGCAGAWTTVEDTSGAQTHSGIVYNDNIWAWAYTKNNGSTYKAWVNLYNSDWNPGGCAAERIIPSRGTPFKETCKSPAP